MDCRASASLMSSTRFGTDGLQSMKSSDFTRAVLDASAEIWRQLSPCGRHEGSSKCYFRVRSIWRSRDYGDGLMYLTWYPVCLREISSDVSPPQWPTYPAEPLYSQIFRGTLESMAQFIPSLGGLDPCTLQDVTVKGGAIVAWGQTDIYDPGSELHHRYEIGITSTGRFHSIDPGKLTMIPYFADLCADRIMQDIRR